MSSKWIVLAACAALVLAGCANPQGTRTHRLTVELEGAESASCASPQAIGDYIIEAPGEFRVEPEQPTVEVICNAEGYQETYASFEEVYNDGSAGQIFLGAVAFGAIGAAAMASQDSVDSLPNRVVITMVPEGEIQSGPLAEAEYYQSSDIVEPVSYLSPAYTRAEPPEGSELAEARAAAESQMNDTEKLRAQEAKLQSFEARLASSKGQLASILDAYNRKTDFAVSQFDGKRLNIVDVAKVSVLYERPDGYVVRIVGNAGLSDSWSDDVYDEHFLIEERLGAFRILAHGDKLARAGTRLAQSGGAADAGSAPNRQNAAKLRQFEDRLKARRSELRDALESYNDEAGFEASNDMPAHIKDASVITVVEARGRGYVVRIVGNSELSAMWYQNTYNELFLIEERAGRFVILDHGKSLEPASTRIAGGASGGPTDATLRRFEQRLKASRTQLTKLLNSYNNDAGFILRGGKPLKIKDASQITVVGEREPGFVVRIVGNSGLGPMWSEQVYDEYFLIADRGGRFAILDHGKALSRRQMSAL